MMRCAPKECRKSKELDSILFFLIEEGKIEKVIDGFKAL